MMPIPASESAKQINPPDEDVMLVKHVPLGSITASAKRIKGSTVKSTYRASTTVSEGWQEDAWDMYDSVGEQRFLASTLANRMSQAKIYVGKLDGSELDHPAEVENPAITAILTSIGGGRSGMAQMIRRLGVNLFIAGEGWIVGLPAYLMPDSPTTGITVDDDRDLALTEWNALSVSEVAFKEYDVELRYGPNESDKVLISPEVASLIRVWRPHPRKAWQADSPTRSSLPVLRELNGLTQHVGAQIDSRLAGAGLLVIPQSAQQAMKNANPSLTDQDDPFTEALIENMITPIQDRASASAIVPLVVTVPDELTSSFVHVKFSTPFDTETISLRNEAIRRLALGQDAPPELLLGTGGMNHWGAWLVREDVVNTHIEPPLSLICDALTTQLLWPTLIDGFGMSPAEAYKHVIWYDVSDMIVRPNRGSDSERLYNLGVVNGKAVRLAHGFDDEDAPEFEKLSEAERAVFDMVKRQPDLIRDPGIAELLAQVSALLEQTTIPEPPPQPAVEQQLPDVPAPPRPPESTEGGPPDPGGAPV